MKSSLLLLPPALVILGSPTSAQHTVRASVDSFGNESHGASYGAALSSDGRYVAFASEAPDLVMLDTNGVVDVFVRDLVAGTTRRVSVSSTGVQGNDQSGVFPYTAGEIAPAVAISGNGRKVAFLSVATNFGGGATSSLCQAYVRDLGAGATELASVGAGGAGGDGPSSDVRISADGRHVVFLSYASDLVPGDPGPLADLYARDLSSHTTVRLAPSTQTGNDYQAVSEPAVSASGRFVAFQFNHVFFGTSNSTVDIHVIDRDTDGNGIFDEAGGTHETPITNVPNGGAFVMPAISATGRYLTFLDYTQGVFRHDRDTDGNGVFDEPGGASTVQIATEVSDPMSPVFARAPVSADGNRVAYLSRSGRPVSTIVEQAFVHDVAAGTDAVVSYRSDTGEPGLGEIATSWVAMSADGSRVAYDTLSSNLVAGDTNGTADVFAFLADDPNCFGTTSYCIGAPNSAGLGGLIGWSGSLSVAENHTTLTAVGLPANAFGLYLYGPDETQVPFGDGFRCVAPGSAGLHRLPALHADAQGHVQQLLRFDLPPLDSGSGAVVPGGAWNFQLWYRDGANGGAGFNTTDALHAVFCP